MFNRFQKDEEGFTLIELLVVVIIIGILAAIAIPTFLSQRERGYQAELTSSVRNYALEAEAAGTSNGGVYPAAVPVPAALTSGATITMTYASSGTAFTICGTTSKITTANNVKYESATGGLKNFVSGTGCV